MSHPTTTGGGRRIKFNVGGKIFETTSSTIHSAGSDSLLASLAARSTSADPSPAPPFIDRDPEIFSILLHLLRSGRLPSSPPFSIRDLIDESLYYGIDLHLRAAMSPPPLLGIDADLAATVVPFSGVPTAIAAGSDDGSLWIAHSGQISSYDWSLSHSATVRTHASGEITSLRQIWPQIAAFGSPDSPGLHLYDVSTGRRPGSVRWSEDSDPRLHKSTVTAIAAGNHQIYAAFEAPHRENCVLAVDRETMRVAAEIGRMNGSSVRYGAPGKLVHMAAKGLVFSSAVSSSAFGYSGYMRLWDPRSPREPIWEAIEPGGGGGARRYGDTFADADVDDDGGKIYKVCWKSGDLAVADLRKLGGDDPWVFVEEPGAAVTGPGGAANAVVCCYKGQVFVGKEKGLEVWSPATMDGGVGVGGGGGFFRRSYVDREEDARRGLVRRIEVGGDRLFLSREGAEGVEVWESSRSSGAISII